MTTMSKLLLSLTTAAIMMLVLMANQAPSAMSDSIKAPQFTLENNLNEAISLADFHGKPVILHFWATWCPYCKRLQPGLEQLRLRHQDSDLVILGISILEEEGAEPAAVLKQNDINFMTLLEGDKVAQLYEVQGTPTTVFINRNGEIVWKTSVSDPFDPDISKAAEFILQ
ncbi:TlpA disulfide reductase family protein [Shewanella maritima]|uniref:TlpA disulfide reductase family protein n=1 Tax=Shewanella maritima TaxID=2520507 RepID=UPI003736B4C4